MPMAVRQARAPPEHHLSPRCVECKPSGGDAGRDGRGREPVLQPAHGWHRAALAGGRWNRPGTPAVYTSTHLSLAAVERLQYHDPGDAPRRLLAAEIVVPDDSIIPLDPLPDGWERFPHPDETRAVGDGVLSAQDGPLGLLVPTAAFAPPEMNVVLNPRHVAFPGAVRVVSTHPFVYSPRLG
jgi:RES domain-containing protein